MTTAFPGMSKEASVFYSKMFAGIMLNLHAHHMGLFPYLLCEHDDPKIARLWHDAVPEVMTKLRERGKLL